MPAKPRIAAMIGAGLIGRAWANVFARAGWQVRLYDPAPEARANAVRLVTESLDDLARHGLVTDPKAAAERLVCSETLAEAVDGAELVQESGPERLDDKIALVASLDELAPRNAILASSSSAIVASRFTETLAGRARCLIAHPVNPPHVVPIVELCGAPWTAPETIARAHAIYDGVGQVPIQVKKEIDGFILNRMQAVLLSEALRLVQDGYVTAGDLDKTIAHGLGLRWSFMGPFETIELNAPGGIADYCDRYGATLYKLSSHPVTPDIWEADNTARAAASLGPVPTKQHVSGKSRWRDERLAALIAHKRAQKEYPS